MSNVYQKEYTVKSLFHTNNPEKSGLSVVLVLKAGYFIEDALWRYEPDELPDCSIPRQ
tara:strand:+ start:2892 stop:3065 length:174 start_codon:yes stop_codon:yes gene_type:complete